MAVPWFQFVAFLATSGTKNTCLGARPSIFPQKTVEKTETGLFFLSHHSSSKRKLLEVFRKSAEILPVLQSEPFWRQSEERGSQNAGRIWQVRNAEGKKMVHQTWPLGPSRRPFLVGQDGSRQFFKHSPTPPAGVTDWFWGRTPSPPG